MRPLLALFSVAVVFAACAGSFAPRAQNGHEDTFVRSTLAAYRAFSDHGAAWRIEDGSLLGDGAAIRSVLIREGDTMRDGWVETRTGRMDDGGLVLRFQDNRNYYLLAIRDDASPDPREYENLKATSARMASGRSCGKRTSSGRAAPSGRCASRHGGAR